MKKKTPLLKKSAPLWAILVTAVLCSGSVAALMLYSIGVENISIWGGEIQDSKFIVVDLTTKIKGPNRVDISLTIRNTDTETHSATVTVSLLYENGDMIIDNTQIAENITTGNDALLDYEFKQSGLTVAYDRSFVVIRDV